MWASSRAALPILNSGLLPSNAAQEGLRALASEIGAGGVDSVAAALDREIASRAERFVAGLEAYRRHPFGRRRRPPVVWRAGTTRLLDYGRGDGTPVLIIPSLINRYYVLDLLPERSFLDFLARQGLHPLVVDWGAPGAVERNFDLSDYIARRLEPAVAATTALAGGPPIVLGYCMGGLLALALALRGEENIAGVALLATPWDFHAERAAEARALAAAASAWPSLYAAARVLPVELIQFLFFLLDPFLAARKFVRFAALDPASEAARGFVALEDWINDGVPLALAVAEECVRGWYGDNAPARGAWRVDGVRVRPERLRRPALVVLPARDRIVPPRSAAALAEALPRPDVMRPPLGHIGMMTSAAAPVQLWAPLAEWLRRPRDPV